MHNKNIVFRLFIGTVILICFAAVANAQFKASVQGTVTDTAGAAVPAATLTLTNKETNKVDTTTESDDGFYRFSSLPPGTYSLSVEK